LGLDKEKAKNHRFFCGGILAIMSNCRHWRWGTSKSFEASWTERLSSRHSFCFTLACPHKQDKIPNVVEKAAQDLANLKVFTVVPGQSKS